LREDLQDFLSLQIFGRALGVALEWDGKNGLALGQIRGSVWAMRKKA
jgi:hypothetical protein